MKRNRIIGGGIFLIIVSFLLYYPLKPRLISSITTIDTTYLTILVSKAETFNEKNLEEKILKMCRENSFEKIKLNEKSGKSGTNYYISVYDSRQKLKKGDPCMIIKSDAKE